MCDRCMNIIYVCSNQFFYIPYIMFHASQQGQFPPSSAKEEQIHLKQQITNAPSSVKLRVKRAHWQEPLDWCGGREYLSAAGTPNISHVITKGVETGVEGMLIGAEGMDTEWLCVPPIEPQNGRIMGSGRQWQTPSSAPTLISSTHLPLSLHF